MPLQLPPAPEPLDPFAVACDAFTVLGPGVWMSATAALELGPGGARLDHVATSRRGAAATAAGDPAAYAELAADALAALAPPVRGGASRAIRVTFRREPDGLTVALEPVMPPLEKKLRGHPGHAVLTPELVAAIDEAMPAISAREEAWYRATPPDVLPGFEGRTLRLGEVAVPAHLLGVYNPARCHLAWSWEIGGIAPETAAVMARLRETCRKRSGWDVIATPGPRAVHDSTAYLLAWLAGLELGARGVVPLWGGDGEVAFVAAMAAS